MLLQRPGTLLGAENCNEREGSQMYYSGEEFLFILVVAALLANIPARIAQKKGYSFLGWWIYGLLLFIIALPHSLSLKVNEEKDDES